jgi:hypothetical protein
MTFLNAGYLPWLLWIGLPILIHLLTRQPIRTYPLPTFRFLQRSIARQSRLFRLRHLLLLLMRMLLVALLVFVFMKPVLVAPLETTGGGGRVVFIVLDASLSMGYRHGGIRSFQKAQALAARILEGLGEADRANIILAGAAPVALQPKPTADTAVLQQAMRSATFTEERCDMPAAIALAVEQLSRVKAGRKELYLISDFQRTHWAEVKLEAIPSTIKVIFVGTEEGERENLALTGIKLQPPVPRAGDEITVLVEVWNGTPSPRAIPVTLRAGELPLQTQTVRALPYASGTTAFHIKFEQPGRYLCTASLQPDSLPEDNIRRHVIDLQHSLTVYLLTDENAGRSPSGSYFIARALNPTPEVPGGIRVIPKHATALKDADLHAADAVLLSNVLTMPADRLPAIQRYVEGGGTLLVFLYGERIRVQMEALHRLAEPGEGLAFLPTEPVDVRDQGKGYVNLSEARFESRLLRIFKDPSAADLGKIKFYRFFLTTEPDPRAEVLLKFEDGTPAAARRTMGAGSVLLCNFSPSPTDSDLARQEVFPPLLHEFLKGMVGKEGQRREFTPGGVASTTFPPTNGKVTAIGPKGQSVPITIDKEGGGVVLERVEKAGFYTIQVDEHEEAVIAVNIHPDETDLRTIDPRELQSEHERRPTYFVGTRAKDVSLEDLTRNRPLWPYLLLGLFGVLVVEQLVAGWRCGRSAKDLS